MSTTITIHTQSSRLVKSYNKTRKVIETCISWKQLIVAKRMINLFNRMYANIYYGKILNRIYLAKQDEFVLKCN